MESLFSLEKIKQMEDELQKMGRNIVCIDPRNRPGHPPDWEVRFSTGHVVRTCGQERVSILAFALLLKEPSEW